MTPRGEDAPPARPEFLWDPLRLRIVWANEDGLTFWGENGVADLAEQYFAPDGETARALQARMDAAAAGADSGERIVFSHGPHPVWAFARCAAEVGSEGRALMRITLSGIERPGDAVTARMRAGFDAAPRPMAIFSTSGEMLTRNAADRLAFPGGGGGGDGALADRYAHPGDAARALAAALSEGGDGRAALLKGRSGAARWRVSLRRFTDPAAGGLALIAEFADLSLRNLGAPAARPAHGFAEDPPEADYGGGHDRDRADDDGGDSGDGGVSPVALAQIAHDLRAPLTSINGFAELLGLRGEDMSADQRLAYARDIERASRHMLDIVDQIVALGAGDPSSGALTVDRLDLNALANTAVRMAKPRADGASAELLMIPAPSRATALGDKTLVARILDNLIDNALVHGVGARGAGAISVKVVAAAAGRLATIEVRDDGPGMDEATLARALRPYHAPQPGGRSGGLGLSNAVRLAKAMAARLEVATSPGAGFAARLVFDAGKPRDQS